MAEATKDTSERKLMQLQYLLGKEWICLHLEMEEKLRLFRDKMKKQGTSKQTTEDMQETPKQTMEDMYKDFEKKARETLVYLMKVRQDHFRCILKIDLPMTRDSEEMRKRLDVNLNLDG